MGILKIFSSRLARFRPTRLPGPFEHTARKIVFYSRTNSNYRQILMEDIAAIKIIHKWRTRGSFCKNEFDGETFRTVLRQIKVVK